MKKLMLTSLLTAAAKLTAAATDHLHSNPQFNMELFWSEYSKHGNMNTIRYSPDPLVLANVSSAYAGPIDYGSGAINAPLNCLGHNAYIGGFVYLDGVYDPSRCEQRCTNHTIYAYSHSEPNTACRFFNTSFLNKNVIGQQPSYYYVQYCALGSRATTPVMPLPDSTNSSYLFLLFKYTQLWSSSYAVDNGKVVDGQCATVTVISSMGYYNATDVGPCQTNGGTA
ncbi:hypothetical protein F5Y16DRAFT_41799 [Xylariaceae sp. FL0255]|nr:hypothetical protein F5Y16DRAFT_41799 [Xylariaceae sp. FL0255]